MRSPQLQGGNSSSSSNNNPMDQTSGGGAIISTTTSNPAAAPPRSQRPLPVVLEPRSPKEFQSYLEYLRNKKKNTNNNANNNNLLLPNKISIYSDYDPWMRNIISMKQRRQLFEVLSEISNNLKHLQIDLLLCNDLFALSSSSPTLPPPVVEEDEEDIISGTDDSEEEEEEERTSFLTTAATNAADDAMVIMDYVRRRLQVLPCSLVTCILEKAPILETLTLKELHLSSSSSSSSQKDDNSKTEVDKLVSCLQSHPTIRQIDLRWKLTAAPAARAPTTTTPNNEKENQDPNNDTNTDHHDLVVLNPLIEGMVANNKMKHLRQLNLMIPNWCPALLWIPQSTCLETLQLSVENIPESTTMTTSKLLRQWKTNTTLKQLEISSFHILQDSTPLLELIGTNKHLQHITVIDHNVFRRQQQGRRQRSSSSSLKRSSSSSKTISFAQELTNVLGTNTSLKHLHLISKKRRRQRHHRVRSSSYATQQQEQQQSDDHDVVVDCDEFHRQLLGEMMEHNFVMERLEISHGGLQISAPAPSSRASSPSHHLLKTTATTTTMGHHHHHRRQEHGNSCNLPLDSLPPTKHHHNNSDFHHTTGGRRRPCIIDDDDDMDKLDFFLRLNQDGYRRKLFLSSHTTTKEQGGGEGSATGNENQLSSLWYEAVLHYRNDTASLFSLIQTSPSTVVDILLSGQKSI